jgi:hypothetical protein
MANSQHDITLPYSIIESLLVLLTVSCSHPSFIALFEQEPRGLTRASYPVTARFYRITDVTGILVERYTTFFFV